MSVRTVRMMLPPDGPVDEHFLVSAVNDLLDVLGGGLSLALDTDDDGRWLRLSRDDD